MKEILLIFVISLLFSTTQAQKDEYYHLEGILNGKKIVIMPDINDTCFSGFFFYDNFAQRGEMSGTLDKEELKVRIYDGKKTKYIVGTFMNDTIKGHIVDKNNRIISNFLAYKCYDFSKTILRDKGLIEYQFIDTIFSTEYKDGYSFFNIDYELPLNVDKNFFEVYFNGMKPDDFIQQKIDSYYEQFFQGYGPLYLKEKIYISYQANGLLSIASEYDEYSGGVKPFCGHRGFVYDLEKKQEIGIWDFFEKNLSEYLREKIVDEYYKSGGLRLHYFDINEDFLQFSLTNSNTVAFSFFGISLYHRKLVKLTIKKIACYIKPEFRKRLNIKYSPKPNYGKIIVYIGVIIFTLVLFFVLKKSR